MNTDPLGRIAEHASKPYPTDHIVPAALVRHWENHFAYELRDCPVAELRWALEQTQSEIAALTDERNALKSKLLEWERITTKIGKLQGKARAMTRLLERKP